jgi:two-component system sensor histidine kinase RegB
LSKDLNAVWLTRLRWAAIVGQTVTILVARLVVGPDIRLPPLLAIVAAQTLFNLAVALLLRRGTAFGRRTLLAHFTVDLIALTALLHFSGGPSNPFNFLYLVQIVLAAVLLGARPAYFLIAVSAALFGALFFTSGGEHVHQHFMMEWHLEGMWIAFVIAAILIVLFVGQILGQLGRQRAELEAERERASRHERLSSLATLAAGTAHELATPLSTIAVVSKELARRARSAGADELVDDTELLREEVRRCQEILERMAVSAGQSRGESVRPTAVGELVDSVLEGLARERVDVRASEKARTARILIRGGGLRHAVRAVVENALDASGDSERVDLSVDVTDGALDLVVTDRGRGIPEELRARVVEPFFTTKPPGKGMGLGLFLTDNVLRQMGGRFDLEPGPGGRGTAARLRVPLEPSPPSEQR